MLAAQQILTELWKENKLPFKLIVGTLVEKEAEYEVLFFDSRLYSVQFSLQEGQSFQEAFRDAVLGSVSKLGGPLTNWNYRVTD